MRSGHGRFWDRKGRSYPTPAADSAISLILTLDRIDPLYAGVVVWAAEDDRALPRLTVSLADLLLVADVLSTPTEFIAYLLDRAEVASRGDFLLIAESDSLALWCRGGVQEWMRTVDPDSHYLDYGGGPF